MIGHYIWVIVIGFIAGVIAKFIMPGPNNPSGFVMTSLLGIVGSLVANFVAVKLGWIGPGEGGLFLSGIVGAVVLLGIYHLVAGRTGADTI